MKLRKISVADKLREIIVGNYLNLLSIRQATEILLGMPEFKSDEKNLNSIFTATYFKSLLNLSKSGCLCCIDEPNGGW